MTNEPLRLYQYVRIHMVPSFEAVGWRRTEGTLEGTSHGFYSVLMTRDVELEADRRMALVIANQTEQGEIELIARVNNKEEITILPRSVAVALISTVARALGEP